MIPPMLSMTQVQVRKNGTEQPQSVRLEKFGGYPSRHYKAEFFHWLRGLNGDEHTSSILAASLIIESIYYLGQVPAAVNELRGKDFDCLQGASDKILTDLDYERLSP